MIIKYKSIRSLLIILFFINACSMANKDKVSIIINSYPTGSPFFINDYYYGTTPAKIELKPTADISYKATIYNAKNNNDMQSFDLETWYSIRGGRGMQTTRCILDAFGSFLIIPIAGFLSIKCRDFKQKQYFVDFNK